MEKDHVPPECIFPEKDKPNNLLTVKCCKSCHDSFDKLDEKMRNQIAILSGAQSGEVGKKAMRVLTRSPKHRNDFLSQTKEHPSLVDDEGNPRALFFFDDNDLKPWLIRIVKGLYFRKHKNIYKSDLDYKIEKLTDLDPPSSMSFEMDEGLEMRPYFVYGLIKECNFDFGLLIFFDRIAFSVKVDYT